MSEEEKLKATQLGLHSVKNILGAHQQTDLFSEHHKDFCEEYGIKLEGTIDRFGVDLTEIQSRIMEGILYGFSKTAYKGNIDPTSRDQLVSQKFSGKIPESYKYIHEIPKVRVTQSELLEWAGINKSSIASWSRAVEAIQELGKKQYCFYYDRLALDESGNPIRDKKNKWLKEEVISVDTLFSIKEIRDKSSGTLKYYEIMPSAVFLDQRESYFMFIPLNWRDEVKALVGNKKASSYTFRFLLFLRYQYELKRRSKGLNPPYKIKWSPEEIAMAIKMPQSVYLRKKKRASEILEDAYIVAKRLGYLTDYERVGHIDILTLNDKKYFNSRNLSINPTDVLEENPENLLPSAKSLFSLFYEQKRKLDPHHEIPEGLVKEKQIQLFQNLLRKRQLEDIERLIVWTTTQKYWCSRISTPSKLVHNFSEAWSEMVVGSDWGKDQLAQKNKLFSSNFIKKIKNKPENIEIYAAHKYVEIVVSGSMKADYIHYDDQNFECLLKTILNKHKIVV